MHEHYAMNIFQVAAILIRICYLNFQWGGNAQWCSGLAVWALLVPRMCAEKKMSVTLLGPNETH